MPNTSSSSQIECRHFGEVADEQVSVGHRRMIPRFSVQYGKPRHFLVTLGSGADQRQIAVFREDDQMPVRKKHLSITVPTSLPPEFAGGDVETGQNCLIQTVHETFMQHGARELILHPIISPDFAHGESWAIPCQFDNGSTRAIAG